MYFTFYRIKPIPENDRNGPIDSYLVTTLNLHENTSEVAVIDRPSYSIKLIDDVDYEICIQGVNDDAPEGKKTSPKQCMIRKNLSDSECLIFLSKGQEYFYMF